MRLSKKVNKKNTIYTIIGDYININGKRSTYAYESLGNDDKLIERFGKENTMDKVYEYIDSLNKTIKDGKELPVPVPEEKPVVFKQLEVQTPVAGTQAAVIIRLPFATVEVAEGTSQATVEAVLLALRCLC